MLLVFFEVELKRLEWKSLTKKQRKQRLNNHWIPCVLGPNSTLYMTDHHHLAVALLKEGCDKVKAMLLRDFSALDIKTFWRTMEFYGWSPPYDKNGTRVSYDHIPLTINNLEDDPYRSLAGALRVPGGFAKDVTPYAEFLWADYFRHRIPAKQLKMSLDSVLQEALLLAGSDSANHLPG